MDRSDQLEVLAIIPARGGSKTIPRKNIKDFAGFPLIAYSIAAGLQSQLITRVIVSTDDKEIGEVSQRYGAEVPFLRPAVHAQDQTPDLPVFEHALNWLSQQEDYRPEIVVQLRPTSPLRRMWHIDDAVRALVSHPQADSVRTVVVPFQNPFKMWTIGDDGLMHPLLGPQFKELFGEENIEAYNMPRQALPDVYWQTGYVDAAWSRTILEKKSMTGDRILPLVIDPGDWVDIDSPDDWQRAEQRILNQELSLDDLGFQMKEI